MGASPEYWFIIPLLAACGTGIVSVIGLWNLRLLGSTVTIGDTPTRLPSSFETSSPGIGCDCKYNGNNTIIITTLFRDY